MSTSNNQIIRWAILLLSVCAYIYSLFLPALLFEHHEPVFGGELLANGWWGFLMGEFAWLANLAYIVAIFVYIVTNMSNGKGANIVAICFCIITLIFGFTSFHAKTYEFAGSSAPIIRLGSGFYLWMYSFFILLMGCFISEDSPAS